MFIEAAISGTMSLQVCAFAFQVDFWGYLYPPFGVHFYTCKEFHTTGYKRKWNSVSIYTMSYI